MATIALLTDFGQRDWYVGAMKGVIRSITPLADIVDISHEIPPQNVKAASFVLWNAYRYFPMGTVFVCVVDPGVGSERAIFAVEAGGYIFVAPDNGLLDRVMTDLTVRQVVKVEKKQFFRAEISHTFHGRDIFAPVGAHISNGARLTELGPEIEYGFPELPLIEASHSEISKGEIIYIDHFGNLVTNIFVPKHVQAEVQCGDLKLTEISRTYAEVEDQELLALVGSSGLLEIAMRNGSAAKKLQAAYGTPVSLSPAKVSMELSR